MLIIHTTTTTKKEAKYLIKLLLESNLIACGQYCKITSCYVWEDEKDSKKHDSKIKKTEKKDCKSKKYCKQSEYLLMLKTIKKNYSNIEKLLLARHSYEVPEIVAFKAKTHSGYNTWLYESLN